MAIGVPLKLKDSADFQDFSSTDENYLAYQIGNYFISGDSSSVGALALDSNGTNVIQGTFTDTSFDSAVGTGGDGSFLTVSFVTTFLRQNLGTISITDSDYRIPVYQYDSGGQRIIQESTESDLNTLIDRLNSRIFTSDYLGTYKLGSSAPSGDYSVELANVTTDTRADGTSIQYNIYQRTNQTPPTKVLPFSIKRLNGDSGDYQGLQLMTDRQIQQSLGLIARNRIGADSDGIGSYKVLSSSAGTPTDNGYSGTWAAKGTATDTRQVVVDTNYTRSRVSTYARLRVSNFSADYQRTRNSAYVGDFLRTRSSAFSATYQQVRQSNYSLGFIGNYVNNFTRTRASTYSRTLTYEGNYLRTRESNYIGDYARLVTYSANFSRNVTYTSAYTYIAGNTEWLSWPGVGSEIYWNGAYIGSAGDNDTSVTIGGFTYERGSYVTFVDPYDAYQIRRVETSTVSYTGNRNSTLYYTRTRSSNFVGNYLRSRDSNFDYITNFTGDYIFDFTRTIPDNFTRDFIGNYGRDFSRVRTSNFSANYSRNFIGNYLGDFAGDFLGNYSGPITYTSSYSYSKTAPKFSVELFYLGGSYYGQYWYYNGTQVYSESGGTEPTVGDTRTVGGTTYVMGSFQEVEGSAGGSGAPSSSTVYHSIATRSTGTTNYTRTSLRNSQVTSSVTRSSNYTGNYTGDFTLTRTSTYTRTRTSTYLGAENFSRNFTGNYVGNYSRNFTLNRTSTFSRNFTGNYQGDYSRNFIGNYARTFVGNYAGATIGSGNTTVQTFTLYVRIA